VSFDGEAYYRISGYDRMPSFLMAVASDTDIWMYVTSTGGLTAGRVDPDGCLFPYETADKLQDAHHHTGPITLLRVRQRGSTAPLWQPFSKSAEEAFRIERNLYKNVTGSRLVFEEVNRDLEITFRYRWSACDEFGIVRTATLSNHGSSAAVIDVLDGLRNVLPFGVPLSLQQQMSSLVDAYRRTDCDPETRMGIFSLTSRIIDRPEAAEELRANAVWCHGLGEFDVCLSLEAIEAFRRGDTPPQEQVLTGRRGNYFVVSSVRVEPHAEAAWHLAADVGRSHIEIAALRSRLLKPEGLGGEIEGALLNARENLRRNVGSADGLQLTGHEEAVAHHFANVLFNNTRGGVFAKNYDIPAADLRDFIRTRNRSVAERLESYLRALPAEISLSDLLAGALRTDDADYQRLCYEYLPIYFARRHGDPSRPWNRFSIRVKNPDGTRALRYEGNWRDIFQNWEALSESFPDFLPGIISKFVNASTVDGYNPYRITRDGVDWEVADPSHPWSCIGYWGDHQIIYLLKFLEALRRFSPGSIESLLHREIFCYADVPYRIKPYEEVLENPRATIGYDGELASRIGERVAALGTDGKLLPGADGRVYHANLLEKLLVPALSKLSNLVPDGGIWMNTQRPEWNDANNALAGYGLSVVTLCHLRRHVRFLETELAGLGDAEAAVSNEVAGWLRTLHSILNDKRALLSADTLSDADRKSLMDALGEAFAEYRAQVYTRGFSGKTAVRVADVVEFCRVALEYLDHAIRANRREDGLYHSYNLLELSRDGKDASVRPLYEMLEGQVAVLSSGVLSVAEAVELVSHLFASRMYREDQESFLLYPEKELPSFLEKNEVSDEALEAIPLLRDLVEAGERSIVARDALGVCRFNGDIANAADLASALDRLARDPRWAETVARDRRAVLDVFESIFHHRSFTGRSGAMYGYEGIGCVYWHMVAKLLLAVQETALRAADENPGRPDFQALAKLYYLVRHGLGFEKAVADYGAFPTDPYSHTPRHAGAQQPGMTGQVKEEILTRFGELGVRIEEGAVAFRPVLLTRREFLKEPGTYQSYDLDGAPVSIEVPAGSLAFSFCQVPIIYRLTRDETWIRVASGDGTSAVVDGARLDAAQSRRLFGRAGGISRIDVGVAESSLFQSP
jgi:hypothetical protein